MVKRQKKVVITGITREQAEEAFGKYAKANAGINKINAEIDLACAKIRDKYADRLARLGSERDETFDTLQAYATENQAELFIKKKSLDMAHGTIGFRTGTPKLKTLKGFTWASATQLAKKFLEASYMRQTWEIAKDKLLADRDVEKTAVYDTPTGDPREVSMREAMAVCGIFVDQDETFFVEPKSEENEE